MANTFLIGIDTQSSTSLWNGEESIRELKELAETTSLSVVGHYIQKRRAPHPKSYLGLGAVDQVLNMVQEQEVEVVIADDELSPAQLKYLEKTLEVKILDRTSLVLDIFASRAKTHEAKLQVELAQLDYLLPRLTRLWTHLSRLGGGIGTRGPGETQLEVDKRQIQKKITVLKKGLQKVRKNRDLQRKQRGTIPLLTAALVGYTNSGKSTLMNKLTKSNVYAEDQLFATLDPTTRKVVLDNREEILLSDTVGFIQKLPHQLVDAFMATLEEVVEADFLIHVIDSSHPKSLQMIETTLSVLKDIGCANKPMLFVFNKVDLLSSSPIDKTPFESYSPHIYCSALKDKTLSSLKDGLEILMRPYRKTFNFHIPTKRMDILQLLHHKGQIIEEEFDTDTAHIQVNLNRIIGEKIMGMLGQKIP